MSPRAYRDREPKVSLLSSAAVCRSGGRRRLTRDGPNAMYGRPDRRVWEEAIWVGFYSRRGLTDACVASWSCTHLTGRPHIVRVDLQATMLSPLGSGGSSNLKSFRGSGGL
eukprot:418430-Prymnesium_polylepis.1